MNIGHMIASGVLHGAIYGVMYAVFKHLGVVGGVVTAALLIFSIWLIFSESKK